MQNDEWDLKDYCKEDSTVFRYYGMYPGVAPSVYFDGFFASAHEDYYAIFDEYVHMAVVGEDGIDLAGYVGFFPYYFIAGEFGTAGEGNKLEGALEFQKHEYDYDEAINRINETEWTLECIYSGNIELYIDHNNKDFMLFDSNNYSEERKKVVFSAFEYEDLKDVGTCPRELPYAFSGGNYTYYLPYKSNLDNNPLKVTLIGFENIKDKINNIDQTCDSLLGNPKCEDGQNCEPAFYIQFVFNVMKYIAIILVIVFTTIDFIGAVSAQDDDKLKKAMSKVVIRLIWCVLIFVLPTLLEFLFTFMEVYSPSTCGIN